MIVDKALYRRGVREEISGPLPDALAELRTSGDGFIWIGLHEPSMDEVRHIADDLKLHPLAVEDAVKAQQRPKLDAYEGSLFLVLKTVSYDEDTQQIELGDVMVFLNDAFIVTVRHGEVRPLKEVKERLEHAQRIIDCGTSAVLYEICDQIVDDYTDITNEIDQDIEDEEQRVFDPRQRTDTGRIYNLKRETIEFRRAVRPLVEPMHTLASGNVPGIHPTMLPFFRDVADHTIRVSEAIESFDDLLTSALNANLTQVSVQQNTDTRKISAWAAIFALPTLIASIYGMNFEHMPELSWRFGYPASVAAMALTSYALYRIFKHTGWL